MQVLVRHRWLVEVDPAGAAGWATVLERLGHRVFLGRGSDGGRPFAAVDSALHGRTVLLSVSRDEPGPRPAEPGSGPGTPDATANPQPARTGGSLPPLATRLARLLQRAGATVIVLPALGDPGRPAEPLSQPLNQPLNQPLHPGGPQESPAGGTSPGRSPGTGGTEGPGGGAGTPDGGTATAGPLGADLLVALRLDAVSLRARVRATGRNPWAAWQLARRLARSLWWHGCVPVHRQPWPGTGGVTLSFPVPAGAPDPPHGSGWGGDGFGWHRGAGRAAGSGAPATRQAGSSPAAARVVLSAPLAVTLTLPAGWPDDVVAAALYSGLVAFFGGPPQPLVPWGETPSATEPDLAAANNGKVVRPGGPDPGGQARAPQGHRAGANGGLEGVNPEEADPAVAGQGVDGPGSAAQGVETEAAGESRENLIADPVDVAEKEAGEEAGGDTGGTEVAGAGEAGPAGPKPPAAGRTAGSPAATGASGTETPTPAAPTAAAVPGGKRAVPSPTAEPLPEGGPDASRGIPPAADGPPPGQGALARRPALGSRGERPGAASRPAALSPAALQGLPPAVLPPGASTGHRFHPRIAAGPGGAAGSPPAAPPGARNPGPRTPGAMRVVPSFATGREPGSLQPFR